METISGEGSQFLEAFERLPEELQKAALVLMEHADAIWEICDQQVLALEERDRLLKAAEKRDDPLLRMMVELEEHLHE